MDFCSIAFVTVQSVDGIAAMEAIEKDPRWIGTYREIFSGVQRGCTYGLVGPRGTGKTLMACMLVADLATRKRANYTKLSTIMRKIRSTWNSRRLTEEQVFDFLAGLPILIIDELHEMTGNEPARAFIADLVDRRYARMLGTILIANFTVDEFIAFCGPSALRRINERGEVIETSWPSFCEDGVTPMVQARIEMSLPDFMPSRLDQDDSEDVG